MLATIYSEKFGTTVAEAQRIVCRVIESIEELLSEGHEVRLGDLGRLVPRLKPGVGQEPPEIEVCWFQHRRSRQKLVAISRFREALLAQSLLAQSLPAQGRTEQSPPPREQQETDQ